MVAEPDRRSNFGALREGQRVINIDTQIPHSVFDVGMTQQDLNRAQVSSRLVDERCLRAAKRVGAKLALIQPDGRNPFVHQARVLPRTQVSKIVDAAREGEVVDLAVSALEPCREAFSCFRHDFEGDIILDVPNGFP